MLPVVALDVGGANLKLSDGAELAISRPFALWKQPEKLVAQLTELLHEATSDTVVVATMTGELADCFSTKAEGVRHIVSALVEAAAGRSVYVYALDARLVSPHEACEAPLSVASANWHALARYIARSIPSAGLLIDIGSTTSDLIPLVAGEPFVVGHNDPERLASGELVYTGVARTPLCSVVARLPWGERRCRVAHELFATTLDAYLTLGYLSEQSENHLTADGRPATRTAAHDRLARAICADRTMFTAADALAAAKVVMQAQLDDLSDALRTVVARIPLPLETVVVSGQGEFLAHRLVDRQISGVTIVSLSRRWGSEISAVAPAYALAQLARASLGG